jgi:hypothetical protein
VHFSPSATTAGAQTATLTVTGTPGGSAPATLTGTAATPAHLTILPPAGFTGFKAQIGQSQSATFSLENTGGMPSGKPTITAGGDFTVPAANDNCTAAVGATACTFVVTYTPTSASSSATLTAAATPGGPATYALTGTSTTPVLAIDANIWAPSTDKGKPVTKTFTVSNKGTGPTAALQATLTTGNADLTMANGCAQVLNPGSTCQITLTFTATADEAVAATLTVQDTATDKVVANVKGGAGMVIAPATWDFGTVSVSGPYPTPVDFTLTNYGSSALLASMSYVAADADWFSPSDTCSQKTLAQGATCTITFGCHPLAASTTETMQVTGSGTGGAVITNTLTATCKSN